MGSERGRLTLLFQERRRFQKWKTPGFLYWVSTTIANVEREKTFRGG